MSTAPNQTVSKLTPALLAEITQPLLLIQVRPLPPLFFL